MSVLNANYIVTMPDNSKWSVPVRVIALHRAQWYLKRHPIEEMSITLALGRVRELFEGDEFEIIDWAQNSMNWSDVEEYAECVQYSDVNFQDGWMDGNVSIGPEGRDGV